MRSLIVDTSALLAYFNANDVNHRDVVAALAAHPDASLVISPYVVAEVDYLVATRFGVAAELAVLADLTGGAWELASLSRSELSVAAGIIDRYADQSVGVADASLVVLADRYDTTGIVTLDRRHFAVLRSLTGRPFDLLPT